MFNPIQFRCERCKWKRESPFPGMRGDSRKYLDLGSIVSRKNIPKVQTLNCRGKSYSRYSSFTKNNIFAETSKNRNFALIQQPLGPCYKTATAVK